MKHIILLTTLFEHDNQLRMGEFRECIRINCLNPNINRVVIFFEGKSSVSDFDQKYPDLGHEKITIIDIDSRPSFAMFFDYANKHFKKSYIVVANGDIFFDEQCGIEKIRQLKRNHLWLLTRYNFDKNQGKWSLEDAGQGGVRRMLGSHDAWCFLAPIRKFENDIVIGKFGCDSYLAQKAIEASITLQNPSLTIRVKHKHSNMATYSGKRDYQLREDYMKPDVKSCYPPVSHLGQDLLSKTTGNSTVVNRLKKRVIKQFAVRFKR